MATEKKKLPDVQQVTTDVPQTAQTPAVSAPKPVYGGAQTQQTQTQVQPQTQSQGQQQPQTGAQANQQQNADYDVNTMINLPGVSDATKQALGSLVTNGYKPSQAVANALAEVQKIIDSKPGEFQSAHMEGLNNILNQILNRKTFSYDMSNDPLYQNYRQMYMNAGKQAMQDTVGQMSALTGGYGNSWAGTAGQQQHNAYIQQLNDRVPELQQMALDRYNAEGDLLMQQYGLLGDAYDRDYGEWQDRYNMWADERDTAQQRYDTERGFDYGQYQDQVGNWFTTAGMESDQYNTDREFEYQQQMDQQDQANLDRDYYYDWAMTQIENGQMPSEETLRRAGLSEDEIAALLGSMYSGGGSGSGGSGGSGSENKSPDISGIGSALGGKAGSALKDKYPGSSTNKTAKSFADQVKSKTATPKSIETAFYRKYHTTN